MAIVFVVLGHALIYAHSCDFLMGCIYSFHMSLLFILSGFVTVASWERSGAADARSALRKVGRSARRLLVPYVLCGVVVVPMVNAMQTGHLVVSFTDIWRNAFLLNRFLWYLPCCFFLIGIFTVVSLFVRGTRGVRWVLGVAASLAFVVAAHVLFPNVDYIRSVMNYFIPFFAGAWLWTRREEVLHPGRRLLVCTSIAFVALAVLYASLPTVPLVVKGIIKPLAGIASVFPLMAIAGKMKGPFASAVAHVGKITLFLYCFDFFATPITVWYFCPSGILPVLGIASGVIAIGVFINLAWECAILPEITMRLRRS